MTINVPWIDLPEAKYEQLKNGTKGIIFRLSPQYVGKILYESDEERENYRLKDDDEAVKELEYEYEINNTLFGAEIGNVPRPLGIENLRLYNGKYPTFIMEYIQGLPHGDQIINPYNQFIAESLVKAEVYRAVDINVFPGSDFLHPWNYFYDEENERARLIDFGRWTTGDQLKSPYDY